MNKYVFLGDTLLNNEPLGIQRFAYEILKQLDCMHRDYDIEVLIPDGVQCELILNTIPIVKYGSYKSPFIWRQYYFTKYVKKQRALAIDLTLGLTIRTCGIVGLFDLIYENYPEDFIGLKAKIKRESYLIRAKYITKHAKRIITISEYSKKELQKKYRCLKNIDVIYCGWQHFDYIKSDTSILKKMSLMSGGYIFALGSSLPHKNFDWIINAARQNPKDLYVITGTNRLSQYQEKLNTRGINNIVFTGFLTDGEIKALMESCKAFVHPSKYEGFGIPPLEALSCGAHVFVSNATCLPEVFGDAVMYFDPNNYNVNNELMLDGYDIDRKSISQLLEKYSWKKSAEIFNRLLHSLEKC